MKHELELLKQMLEEGIPGRKIKEMLGISIQEQVTYAHAWEIQRKRGRPKRSGSCDGEGIKDAGCVFDDVMANIFTQPA
jgi:hypothetical protein